MTLVPLSKVTSFKNAPGRPDDAEPSPALELESHIFGILARHGNVKAASSNGYGIGVAEDYQGRVFKIEISQVDGPA